VVAGASAGLSRSWTCFLASSLSIAALGCVEGGNLAMSAGAPVTGALQGRITRCGDPVGGAQVLVLVQQDQPEQARPVDSRIGPVTTSRGGEYVVEVAPSFAVPGAATVELRVTADGVTQDIPGGTLELQLGVPPRDTTRFDADLGLELQQC
jgi:hypothetical protein